MNPLLAESHNWKTLLDALREAYPEFEDQDFADTLDGQTNLKERIEWALTQAEHDKAMAEALKAQVDAMQDRRRRFEARADRWKTMVGDAMAHAGLKRLEYARFTVTLAWRKGGALVEAELFDENYPDKRFVRVSYAPDKAAIKAALEADETVAGARLANDFQSITLRIR